MNPGETFTVIGEGPDGGTIEIEYDKHSITVYGWTGSTLMAYRDGVAVCKGNVVMPGLPPNITTKGFVDLLFKPNKKNSSGKF